MPLKAIDRLRDRLRFNVWARLRANKYPSFNLSHSQFGEDMVAGSLFPPAYRGTYVDVGAHHPAFLSNTYHFYQRNWSGLAIDAADDFQRRFTNLRPRDRAVRACVGPTAGVEVTFYRFDGSAYDTTDPAMAIAAERRHGAKPIGKTMMRTQTVSDLIDEHLPGRPIDLLSIDIEGLDYAILDSFDWHRHKPRVVIFEYQDADLRRIEGDLQFVRFADNGYDIYGIAGPSFIMCRRDRPSVLDRK